MMWVSGVSPVVQVPRLAKGRLTCGSCHFLNPTGPLNQQKKGEIKTLKIFGRVWKELHLKAVKNHWTTGLRWVSGEHLCGGSSLGEGEEAGTPRLSDRRQSKHNQDSASAKDMFEGEYFCRNRPTRKGLQDVQCQKHAVLQKGTESGVNPNPSVRVRVSSLSHGFL